MEIPLKRQLVSVAILLVFFVSIADCNQEGLEKVGNRTFCSASSVESAAIGNDSQVECHLHAVEEDHTVKLVGRLVDSGVKLIEYNLSFPYYDRNPLTEATQGRYKANLWQRIFSTHGETLLSLPFDYKVLSMTFLNFGVNHLKVELTDAPQCCFGRLGEEDKIEAVEALLVHEFRTHSNEEIWLEEEDKICHQIIDQHTTTARFRFECCTHSKRSVGTECGVISANVWLSYLYRFIDATYILFLLFGPLLAQKLFADRSFRITPYAIELDKPIKRTLTKRSLGASERDSPRKKLLREQNNKSRKNYNECLKNIPENEPTEVTVRKVYIQVDHRYLMTENDVSVGPLYFIWNNLLLCRVKAYEPFKSCFQEPLFKQWGKWKHVVQTTGLVLAVCIVQAPIAIRYVLYVKYERAEYALMREAAAAVNVSLQPRTLLHFTQDVVQNLCLVSLITYIISAIAIGVIYALDGDRFIEHLIAILEDIKHVKRVKCFRLYLLHVIYPFARCGLLGILFAIPYLIFLLPVITGVTVFYFVPSVYILGRLFFDTPPQILDVRFFLKNSKYAKYFYDKNNDLGNFAATDEKVDATFSEGLMLHSISPESERHLPVKPKAKHDAGWCWRGGAYTTCQRIAIGVPLLTFSLSVLFLYAECFRYLVELVTLTVMGAMVNADTAGKYLVLVFFLLTYTIQVFENVKKKYQLLCSNIFQFIKGELSDSAWEIVKLKKDYQENRALNFFSRKETSDAELNRRIKDVQQTVLDLKDMIDEGENQNLDPSINSGNSSNQERHELNGAEAGNALNGEHLLNSNNNHELESLIDQDEHDEAVQVEDKSAVTFTEEDDRLKLTISSVIFFIDKDDVPRIPRGLFDDFMRLRLHGTPGPLHVTLFVAFRQLLVLCGLFFFVIVVVLAFSDVRSITTTNQVLLAMVGGLGSFIFIRIIKPKGIHLNLNTYGFRGKIHEIIEDFKQSWPVCDAYFDVTAAEEVPPVAGRMEEVREVEIGTGEDSITVDLVNDCAIS